MKFIIHKSKNKQFCFTLVSRNGNVLCTSETYKRKSSCTNAINSIIKKSPSAPIVEKVYKTK